MCTQASSRASVATRAGNGSSVVRAGGGGVVASSPPQGRGFKSGSVVVRGAVISHGQRHLLVGVRVTSSHYEDITIETVCYI